MQRKKQTNTTKKTLVETRPNRQSASIAWPKRRRCAAANYLSWQWAANRDRWRRLRPSVRLTVASRCCIEDDLIQNPFWLPPKKDPKMLPEASAIPVQILGDIFFLFFFLIKKNKPTNQQTGTARQRCFTWIVNSWQHIGFRSKNVVRIVQNLVKSKYKSRKFDPIIIQANQNWFTTSFSFRNGHSNIRFSQVLLGTWLSQVFALFCAILRNNHEIQM